MISQSSVIKSHHFFNFNFSTVIVTWPCVGGLQFFDIRGSLMSTFRWAYQKNFSEGLQNLGFISVARHSTNIYDPCTQKSSLKMAFSRWKSRFSVFSEGPRSFLRKWKYTNQTQIVDWTSKTSKIIFACSAYQNSYS